MYVLEMERLLPGDIILTAQNSILSKTLCKVTNGEFSHVVLYIGNGCYIHSTLEGVHSRNIQRLLFENISDCEVIRLRNRDVDAIQQACIFAQRQVGRQYSKSEAIKSKIHRNKQTEAIFERQFCSRLVAQAYGYSGINLVYNINYCYPIDIKNSGLTHSIKGCVRIACDEEVKILRSDDPTIKQTESINYILENVRYLTNVDIQTLEEIAHYLITNPIFDKPISQIIINSSYLDLWCIDIDRNFWRYDFDEFISLPMSKENLHSLARFEISSGSKLLKLYSFMHEQYIQRSKYLPLNYFYLIIGLYSTIVKISDIRIATAVMVLNH